MVTLFITSFLLLAGITYVIYLWQRPRTNHDPELSLPPAPPRPVGLFEDELLDERLLGGETAEDNRRPALIERAEAGELGALRDARALGDEALYDEVLDKLVERADSDKGLLALASYITRSDAHLGVNRRLAEKFIESWGQAPDRNSTAKMLHIAALSGEAGVYQGAIETAYQFWRDRRLTEISADELRQLIESEFWILAPAVRNSGAGFVLKRKLAQIRRHLVTAAKQSTEY